MVYWSLQAITKGKLILQAIHLVQSSNATQFPSNEAFSTKHPPRCSPASTISSSLGEAILLLLLQWLKFFNLKHTNSKLLPNPLPNKHTSSSLLINVQELTLKDKLSLNS
uniref:Uncharacterized protein n=1 Tax=Oryza sativa subsp. japonica TaxID=39947 RepID=Q8H5I6_ORYSJ|nr:hypothetical protein [Oryza sativa Japonica Group]